MSDQADPSAPGSTNWPVGAGTGIGSLPGVDPEAAVQQVMDLLPDLPHQPELPQRGPAAGIIGRGVALLVEMPAMWSVRAWQLTSRPGRDLRRARSLLSQDGDLIEQAFQSYDGWFKVQIVGPITLAAELESKQGHRAVADAGLRRDLAASHVEGVSAWVTEFSRRLPQARLLVQIDEPTLPAALAGTLSTASGWGRVSAVAGTQVQTVLTSLVESVRSVGAATLVHCCAPSVPIELLRRTGVDAISLDLDVVNGSADEELAVWIEAGGRIFAEATPVTQLWSRTGLSRHRLGQVIVTPSCGLAALSETDVVAAYRSVVAAGRRLRDEAEA